MNRPPAVVLDTNVVLPALVFTAGPMASLRDAWLAGRCRPLASLPTVAELMRALSYPKFKLCSMEQEELLADYLPHCTTVQLPVKLPPVPKCRDPQDRPFLELAVVGRAAYLATGDKDLLGLASKFTCPIVTATAFLDLLPRT
jgi:putative PIN family toxin of toxin-antitoxin system